MVILIGIVESVLSRANFDSGTATAWKRAAWSAEHEAVKAKVLCLGDSLVMYGLCAPVIESLLGETCYNLALPAGNPASSYVLLSRAIEAGAKPRVVLVDFSPFQVAPPSHLNESRVPLWPGMLRTREFFDLTLRLPNL